MYALPIPIEADEITELQSKINDLEKEIIILQGKATNYDYLKEENENYRTYVENELKNYREFVENERAGLFNTISTIFTILGAVITILGIISGIFLFYMRYVFSNSIKEFQEKIKSKFTEIESKFTEIEHDAVNDFGKIIDEKLTQISSETFFHILKQMVSEQLSLKKSKIIVMGSKDEIDIMKKTEIPAIESKGVAVLPPVYEVDDFKTKLDNNEFDIIIYRFTSNEDPYLHEVIKSLIASEKKIPLLLYNYEKGSVTMSKDYTYKWIVYANLPSTLLSHLFTLPFAFYSNNEATKTNL